MIITKKRLGKILQEYEYLQELLANYYEFKTKRSIGVEDVRFLWSKLEAYTNHSCHCHPEYWWEEFGSIDEFYEWFETTDWNKNQKHYTIC